MADKHTQAEEAILKYIALGEEEKVIKAQKDELKAMFTGFLDSVGATNVIDDKFIASKVTKKGSVDMKKVAAKYGIMDSELDTFRGSPSVYWTVRGSK